MNSDKFNADIKRGSLGEQIIYTWLKSLNYYDKIVDVTKDKAYQSDDIDFILFKDGKRINIEVKTDYIGHKTNNLCFEFMSSKSIKSKGCIYITKADFIFYYLIQSDDLFIILKNDIVSLISKLELIDEYNLPHNIRLVNCGDNALGYLIPYYRLTDADIQYRQVKINRKDLKNV